MAVLKRALPWLLLLLVAVFVVWKLHSSHFDWAGFGRIVRTADYRMIALATLVIYSNNFVRAMRWAVFLRPAFRKAGAKPVKWWHLAGSQFIGFAGLAIFGRIGELIRPLLVARRTHLTFSSQVAVVTVERIFDLGAFGLLFSLNLLFAPALRSLPYLSKAGYTIGGLTVFLALFVLVVRLAGGLVASVSANLVGLLSKVAGEAVREKILAFREGLNVIDSFSDFLLAAGLSLALWLSVALAYVLVLHAFPAPVHTLTVAHTIVLMGFSIAGSALPIPGGSGSWAANVFALTVLFGVPQELAGGAGTMLWVVGSLVVVPAGLVFAKLEGISLGQITKTSEAEEKAIL